MTSRSHSNLPASGGAAHPSTGHATASTRRGFTLVEIMVALLIGAMMSVTVIRGIIITETLNQANEQAVVAFGMCKAQMEDVMGRHYEDVLKSNFPRERNIPLTHLGGTHHVPITCTRWTSIAEKNDPTRMVIRTHIMWEYRGKRFRSSVTGVKYPK